MNWNYTNMLPTPLMLHRLLFIPLPVRAFHKELDTIKYIARTNHVDLDINELVRKKQITTALMIPLLKFITQMIEKRNGFVFPISRTY